MIIDTCQIIDFITVGNMNILLRANIIYATNHVQFNCYVSLN